jgi:phage internal scaffolding protein
VQIECDSESKVEQSHRERVDINTIIRKAYKTGLFPQRTDRPTYGDFVGISDYHEALNRIQEAEADFLSLPSEIRSRFDNDAGVLLEWLNKPENLQEAVRIGLRPPGDLPPEILQQTATQEPEPVPGEPVEPKKEPEK